MQTIVKPRFTNGQAPLVAVRQALLYGCAMPNGPAFKEYLVPHIKRLGMTHEAFAAQFGYSKAAVTGWFATGKVSSKTVRAMAALLDVPREEIEAVLEEGKLPDPMSANLASLNSSTAAKHQAAVDTYGAAQGEPVHPLVSKLAAAIRAGQLSATALDMLEAALDSQLVKAVRPSGSNVAVPPPSVLLELRTAQLAADAGTATAESISAMNRRIRSRSNAERSRTQSSIVGGAHRRDKADR